MKKSFSFILGAFLFFNTSCVTVEKPILAYNYAETALLAAKDSEAARFSARNFLKAEKYFKKGAFLYKERDFSRAKKYFILSRKYAEKAENSSRLKHFESGDMLP